MEFLKIKLIGLSAENGKKLLATLVLVAVVLLLRAGLNALVRVLMRGREERPLRFWSHQGVSIFVALVLVVGFLSVWFDNPEQLATVMGLVSAGLAFALQKVVTSVAGYFVILRGGVFSVGDRILMAGVRGDVIALNFTRTTIMEMGQPPGERPDDPNVWIRSRQFTGRIVTVTNDKIFDAAVFNYSRDFPYIWEELTIPITYKDDRRRAEKIMLAVVERHTVEIHEMSQEALERMRGRYFVHLGDLKPRVFMRLTDNWLELSVRFIARDHGVREMKDEMSREILDGFEAAGIGIASATFDIVGLPPLKVELPKTDAGHEQGG
ncbi:MAG TPA: mechanosensitive ion channel domain-containing protein [Pyrinomonadaceae bacterium]|nr:mechanosensitive ion channel domain-containing protein [Pyrinomonadaceae bacterium]